MALKRRRSHPAAPLVGSSRPVLLWTANDATLGMDRYGSWAAGTAPVASSAPVGRALSFTGNTTNALTRAGVSTAAQTKFWFAALFRWRTGALGGGNFPQLLGTSTANNGWRVGTTYTSGSTLTFGIVKGGVGNLSTVTLNDGEWYMAVGSNREDTGEHYCIALPLAGGDMLRTATSSTATSGAGNGTAGIGIARTDFAGAWAGDISFAAAGFEFLPEAFARQWLNAPRPTIKSRRIWTPGAAGGAYTLTADSGSYTLTGQAAGLLAGRVLAAAQGSYALTGQSVALLKGNTLAAAQGSYALTGQDVALLRGLLLSAAQGSYALSGQDATLTYTPLGAFSLTADQGSYTLTGQSVSLLWGPVLAAGQGSYTLNGQDATLTYTPVGAYILTAGQGSYALTGQDVLLQWGHVLAAAQGSYTLTGQAATLARGLVLAAAQGSYTLTGQAAAFARTYVLSAGYGSYALTGQIVSLTYSGAALEALEYLLLISHITQSMSKTSKVTMEVDLISRIQQQLDGSSSI